jgi:hypothetical protein
MQPALQAQARRRDVYRNAGILLVPMQEGPAILEFQKNARSRQDAGATRVRSSHSAGMRRLQRVVANRASRRDSDMNGGSPPLQAMMPGAMK